MTKAFKTAALAMALSFALILGGFGTSAAAAGEGQAAQITVSASGTVRLTPDKASISFGVATQENTAEEAQSKNSEAVNRVIEVLTGRGVDKKSIRTSNYSMYPQYEYTDRGERLLTGYTVNTSLTIQDQNIEDVGKLLSDCVAAGINNVDNISFQCSGYDEAYREALAEAVQTSRQKAEVLAKAAGKTLGDVLTITEGWQDVSARYGKGDISYGVVQNSMDAASFMPGESEISASVTVTYTVK